MHKVIAMAEMYPVMEEAMLSGSRITITVTGNSMLPLLRHQRDTVTLEAVTNQLHRNDVVLYRQESGRFVLHRIVEMDKYGYFTLCGDNQFTWDRHVKRRQVIGRLVAFSRNGRKVSCASPWYKAYVFTLPYLRFLKHGYFYARRYIDAFRLFFIRQANGNG